MYGYCMPDQQTCFGYLDRKQASCEFDDDSPAVCDGVLQGVFRWTNQVYERRIIKIL